MCERQSEEEGGLEGGVRSRGTMPPVHIRWKVDTASAEKVAKLAIERGAADAQVVKTDVTNIDLGLSFIDSLRPVTYKWDDRSGYTGTRTHAITKQTRSNTQAQEHTRSQSERDQIRRRKNTHDHKANTNKSRPTN